MRLLAHCVSLTVNAVRAPRQSANESEASAAVLACEVGLDMAAYWQPTATSYFGRVSKERIVEAVRWRVRTGGAEHRSLEEACDGRSC
jgi:ParB family transcriptional regulator, chromosome partitioning protein